MTRGAVLRLLGVAATAGVAFLGGKWLLARGLAALEGSPRGARLEAPALGLLPSAARAALAGREIPVLEDLGPRGPRRVVLSIARLQGPAQIAAGVGADLRSALAAAAARLREAAGGSPPAGRLKIDVLASLEAEVAFGPGSTVELDPGLDGLVLAGGRIWLLPDEIQSRGLVRSKGELRWTRIVSYLAETGRADAAGVQAALGRRYARARYLSVVEGGDGEARVLYRGNPLSRATDAAALRAAARAAGDHLVLHQREDGSFDYIYRPETDFVASSYNELRHAGTCYALFELSAATGDRRYLEAGERGLAWLLARRLRGPRPEDAAADFAAIASDDPEAKLGGAALALLAMLERIEVTGDRSQLDTLHALARFLLFQQEPDGRFRSKYYYGKAPEREFVSVYYPGEAILALARLHGLDGDPRWLAAARRGADWLIDVRDAGKEVAELPHDHWLLMGLEELVPRTRDTRYRAQAERIAQAIVSAERVAPQPPDWVGSFYLPPRATPAATRSEALVAMARLARREGMDERPYLESLARMIAFQLRCQVTPENAFYLPRPDRALGGFRRSLTVWELRIDYAQHSLSSLLGYRGLLLPATSAES